VASQQRREQRGARADEQAGEREHRERDPVAVLAVLLLLSLVGCAERFGGFLLDRDDRVVRGLLDVVERAFAVLEREDALLAFAVEALVEPATSERIAAT
jgi:hypothetical protein